VLTNCAVRGVETNGGRVSGVVTEHGRIDCETVVLAGGAWSRLFCGNISVRLPALNVLASCFRTDPINGAPETAAGGGGFAFRKRLDGGYSIARRGATYNDITPDSFRLFFDFLPVMSHVDSLPGFFLATGFSGHGFGIGPGAGKLAADLVAGDTPAVDPVPYRYGRFSPPRR